MSDWLSSVLVPPAPGILSGADTTSSGFSIDDVVAPEIVGQAPVQPPANSTDAKINAILLNARPDHRAAVEPLLDEVRRTNPQILQSVMKLVPEQGEEIFGSPFRRQAESLYVLLATLADPSTSKEAARIIETLAGQNTHVIAGSPATYGGQGAHAVVKLDTNWDEVDGGDVNTPVNGTVIVVSPFGPGVDDLRTQGKKLNVDPQEMLANLRNEAFHVATANDAMQAAATDGALPEPFRNVHEAWLGITDLNYEIASSVQEGVPFGYSGSLDFDEVEKAVLDAVAPGKYDSLEEYFVDGYGPKLVQQAKAALEGEEAEPVSELIRRYVAPGLTPEDGARFDALMNDLIEKTKTAILEYERENPGVEYDRMPDPIIDKVWEAIGGSER